MSFEREDDDDDESDDNNGSLDLSIASSLANEREYGGDQVSQKSTSQPLKRRLTTRKKQAEEEYNLIKNLSQSVANKNKRKNPPKQNDTMFEAFGNYIAKALSELDGLTSSLAQNKINNILFQAQAGLLRQELQTQSVIQPQRNYFQPILQTGISSPQPQMYHGENGLTPLNNANSCASWQT